MAQGKSENRRVELRISGRVQGVWFRAETRKAARTLGLVGMVRNMPDGTVHAVAEGPAHALDQFVEYCLSGPPLASVTGVEKTWQEFTGSFDEFTITH